MKKELKMELLNPGELQAVTGGCNRIHLPPINPKCSFSNYYILCMDYEVNCKKGFALKPDCPLGTDTSSCTNTSIYTICINPDTWNMTTAYAPPLSTEN